MTDSAVLREWIVNHGRRDARERIAHLCCEMLIRHRIVAETTDDSFPFPITQEDLADELEAVRLQQWCRISAATTQIRKLLLDTTFWQRVGLSSRDRNQSAWHDYIGHP
jgi:hypothetical protein